MSAKRISYTLWHVLFYSVFCLIFFGLISEWYTLYIRETFEYQRSELRMAKCKRDKESQSIFPVECREALEHLNHYPALRAVEIMKNQITSMLKAAIVDVFDTWTFMFLLLLIFMSFTFITGVFIQRKREQWQYEKHFKNSRSLPPPRYESKPFYIELPTTKDDPQCKIYNRKKLKHYDSDDETKNNNSDDHIDYNSIDSKVAEFTDDHHDNN